MGTTCFLLLIILIVEGYLFGLFIAGRSKGIWIPSGMISLFLLLLALLATCSMFRPDIEFKIFPVKYYIFFEYTWFVPIATFFFGIMRRRVERGFAPLGCDFINLVLLLYTIVHSIWIFVGSGVASTAPLFIDGVCIQSTQYSCGAASLVTMLKHYGIESNEKEMAELSYTVMGWGTKMIRIANALAQKIEDEGIKMDVDIVKINWDGLKRVQGPCIVDIKYSPFMDHVVVVLEIEGDDVILGDPSIGRVTLAKDEFLERWRGYAIILYRESSHQKP